MRGTDRQTGHMFTYLSPEALMPQDHPLPATTAAYLTDVLVAENPWSP